MNTVEAALGKIELQFGGNLNVAYIWASQEARRVLALPGTNEHERREEIIGAVRTRYPQASRWACVMLAGLAMATV